MSDEIFVNQQDTKGDVLAKLRWLQVNELAIKYPNDQEFGGKVRQLIKNTK
tara:strand:+ start:576 stop:728 length:153 start_codon:yes stop_codon:yes gene_type:complete